MIESEDSEDNEVCVSSRIMEKGTSKLQNQNYMIESEDVQMYNIYTHT